MIKVSATVARNNFTHYLNLAAYGGQKVIVERMGKPIAAIVNIQQTQDKIFTRAQAVRQIKLSAGIFKLSKKVNIKEIFRKMKESGYDRLILGR